MKRYRIKNYKRFIIALILLVIFMVLIIKSVMSFLVPLFIKEESSEGELIDIVPPSLHIDLSYEPKSILEIDEIDIEEEEIIEEDPLEGTTSLGKFKITHYCICKKCCGKDPEDRGYGITASGKYATPYHTVAVDPSVIPLGSEVIIDYGDGNLYYYVAEDTGGAIKESRIDVCVSNHEEALNLGVKYAEVYFRN